MAGPCAALALWLEERLQVRRLYEATAGHKVPASTNSWFYVLGSGTLLCFVIQVVTGICLAFVYVPSTDQAWTSLQYLNHQQALGWLLRAIHNWGSTFMVAIMTLHMVQTFLFGAFKFPRELTWISGCVLLLCTLGMAFTGQVLRFDQDAYWGLGIGASIMGRVPMIGAQLVQLLLAGPIIAGETLSRFFTLHVFVLPGSILAIVSLHLRLVLTKGINEYPTPGKVVRRETYEAEYEQLLHEKGVPFAPHVIGKDLVFAGALTLAILACAVVFGPAGPSGPPDPALIHTAPKPDFFFLSVYAVLALLPPYMETFLLLTAPLAGIALLMALPFISGVGEKSPRRRPVAVLTVVVAFLTLGSLAWLGTFAPWSPRMEAWSSTPIPTHYLQGRSPLERRGAALMQAKQCRNCHALDGGGGLRGPALDGVAARLTHDQLIRQVIQGGGNMPAYGKNLNPSEVTALVAFMETLR
ncbi:MAG TPA: cytochrome b N-terminal domain-containing protein [Vicinamibacterales bacterium]|nr:cytochrome b N-terminal domain-containing protein [Vicinamibacterales bacterium]